MAKVSVTLLNADWSDIASDVRRIEALGTDSLQHDVMDGSFVPNISFGSYAQECVHKATKLPMETHMMVNEPQRFAKDFAKAGTREFIVHFEACRDMDATIKAVQKEKMKPGIAISPNTNVEQADRFLREYDISVLLVMGVNPGFGGQSFIPQTVQRIHQARRMINRMRVDTLLEVDGGVNAETYQACLDAGADILAVGSFITGNLGKKETKEFVRKVHAYKRQ